MPIIQFDEEVTQEDVDQRKEGFWVDLERRFFRQFRVFIQISSLSSSGSKHSYFSCRSYHDY